MIHIISNHHKTTKWIKLQSEQLNKNTSDQYKVYCGATDLSTDIEREKDNFSTVVNETYQFHKLENVVNRHADKLNYLSNLIELDDNNKEDLLLFLDPDAFPIVNEWDLQVKGWLKNVPAVAITRTENIEPLLKDDEKPYPHPCFFVTTLGFWKKNNLSWELDPPQGIECAGILLKKWFDENKHQWGAMIRTNCFNLHPLNFGVYGQVIYHHGSGNRPVYDSIDAWCRPVLSKKYGFHLDLCYPEMLEFNQKISDLVFNEINNNPNFIRMYFCGDDHEQGHVASPEHVPSSDDYKRYHEIRNQAASKQHAANFLATLPKK